MGRAHEVRAASMAKTAAKKASANGRAAKEIYMAAKAGGSDPTANLALRSLIDKAKQNQIPSDVIQRAIKRAQGGDAENYVTNRYEALGPGGSALIIEALTSNVNRAAANIREVLNKNHGNPEGKVLFGFKDSSVFAFEGYEIDAVLEILMVNDVEVDDVEVDEGVVFVYAPFKEFAHAKKVLDELGVKEYLVAETKMISINTNIKLSEIDNDQLKILLDKLEELEDVQNIYHNVDL
ncbi:transcriptional regulator [Williamsoniiplasma luminosum]|uniref:Probable transcriptional regulatory protein C5T88_01540 n=1 Tax=Williamsoniiplasma luminosum TaxID=214888 RepID=A0A2K8NUC9_9MOLU|nr:YebC/PmpR family DNA-binding transcriptional regulator [Williamsoniiplasma luminosum]ATZ17450.1 transcriptional regulator [Williamsoniiplasma luminosum]AVP49261.1 MAG: YebC/PmpR family DNA-binding transcriptional regulator [Williamsoniiplasma luminosum]